MSSFRMAVLAAALLLLGSTGCVKRLAVGALAKAMASGGAVYASDNDPELIRDALPFALKTFETLLAERPDHVGLLTATCKGFTQYGFAFVEVEAERVEADDFRRALELRDRALRLYLRARDYGLRALEIDAPGITERLQREPASAAATFDDPHQVERVFWTGAAWGAAISVGLKRPELTADIDAVRALARQALLLDEDFERGAIHTLMISLESLPEAMGGSPRRARDHFERAVELSGGRLAAPFVTFAASVPVAQQDRQEFVRLLETALAIDPGASPDDRLANLVTQQRARILLERIDDLFL